MLVCAVVGLLLLGLGATALPPAGRAVSAPNTYESAPPPAPGAGQPAAVDDPATTAPSSGSPSSAARPGATPSSAPLEVAAAVLVPDTGPGTYDTADVSVPSTSDAGRPYRFDVRVEDGLDLDPDAVARAMEATLDDPRSWRWTDRVRFSLVAAGEPADLHAYVVTPGTTDRLCAPLLTRGEVSCRSGSKVVLNAKRWVFGADAYGDDTDEVAAYRRYLVNHEFGHALGHGHVGCPAPGRPAPVMLQQTKGLQGCRANPWPSVTKG